MSIKMGGLARKAIYICTEGEPPVSRLMQIADAHVNNFSEAFERGNPLDHILIEKVWSALGLEVSRLPVLKAVCDLCRCTLLQNSKSL